jgi:hypothetical protein
MACEEAVDKPINNSLTMQAQDSQKMKPDE